MKASTVFTAVVTAFLTTAPLAAQPDVSRATNFLWMQCNQHVLTLDLDAARLQQVVGSEFSVRTVNGKARVLIVVKDCPTYWVNGEEIGPTQEVHEWVSIEAPESLRLVPGAQQTLPTSTWFSLFVGSTNHRSRNCWTASGTPAGPIASVVLQPPGSKQSGQVVVASDLSYSWDADSAAPFARLVAVNHDVYARNSAGRTVLNRIQVLLNVLAWDSPGRLKVLGGMDPGKLIGPGTYQIAVHTFRPMWAQVSLGEPSTGSR